jgi:thiol-disulfide isomerase/thioredoxin
MNKRTLIVAAVILVAIAAGIAYVLASRDQTKNVPADHSVQSGPSAQQQTQPSVPGRYVDYSSDLVVSASGTKLLFFYAPWCPQCRALDASIKSSTLPDNLTIFKVDYDSNQPLRAKYGVTIQTTVVKIDDVGDKVTSYTAYDEPNFAAVQRALLP